MRIEEYVSKFVEENLSQGRIVRLDINDLMRLVRLGSCTVPSYIDVRDNKAIGPYCAGVLYRLHPNGGSSKREKFGPTIRYEFTPKEVKA